MTREACVVEDLVVIRSQFLFSITLNSTDEVLVLVLLECERHWLLQARNKGLSDFLRAFLAVLNDVSDLDS